MARTTNSQRATTRRGASRIRTDAQPMSGSLLSGRGSAALLLSAPRRGNAGIGCLQIPCRAFAAGTNR